jgi:hypothetical protein
VYVRNDFIHSFPHCACACGTRVVCTVEGGTGVGGWGGVWEVHDHLITHRYAIVHTCTVQCSCPPLSHAHCHTRSHNSIHKAPMHVCIECNARMPSSSFSLTNCLSNPLHHPLPPPPPPRECGVQSITRTTTAACTNTLGPWLALTMSCPPKPPSHHTRMSVRGRASVRDGVWGRYWV